MADQKIPVSEALEITTIEMKKYTDENTISCSQEQLLDQDKKAIAKNNVGVYVGPEEPIDAVNGDLWFDLDDVGSGVSSTPSVSGVTIDKTLTQDGQAADAKVVGDALSEIRNRIEHAPSIVAKIGEDNVLCVYWE